MKIFLVYLSMFLLCLVIFGQIVNIKEANLGIPFSYDGDALYYGTLIKTYLDNGSFFDNKFLGAPGSLNWRDYPETLDNLNLFIIRTIALFSKQWPVVLNLFYILTYPLVGICALYTLLQMKVKTATAFVGSLLFTFLPYHFTRGESHLFLSAYYAVPLAMLICYRINQEQGWRRWSSIISCLILGSTGPYYAFFGGFFIFVTGIYTSLEKKRWRDLLVASLFVSTILAVTVIHLAPNIIFSNENGWNNFFIRRNLGETEIYGLKIAQLLLPIDFHRVPLLDNLKYFYNKESFLINENEAATLGIIGTIGFVLLVVFRIFNSHLVAKENVVNQLKLWGSLVIGGVFLGVVGGGGSILSLFGFSQIRSYNRISIYIAFLAILAVCILIDHFFYGKAKKGFRRRYHLLLLAILAIGLLDQTPWYTHRYEEVAKKYMAEASYFDRISSVVKNDRPIFQLPYVSFPENPLVGEMESYENIKPYLHSNGLRWSYGAMTDRYFDLWQRELSHAPIEEMVRSLKRAGFGGVLINKGGYTDGGTALEKELSEILRAQPLRDEQSRFSFLYFGEMKEKPEPDFPVLTKWVDGCYPAEASINSSWRWCKKKATLIVINPDKKDHRVKFEMGLASGSVGQSRLWVNGLINILMEIDSIESKIVEEIVVPPGRHLVTFVSEAAPLDSAKDQRWLVFRATNYKATDLGASDSH